MNKSQYRGTGQKAVMIGNATVIAYDDGPIVTTDPWIGDEDSAYFGSWTLSHKIPEEQKRDIQNSEYIWFSHGHPDHLNPLSLERFKGNKILLPDHFGSRIFDDLTEFGFNVQTLPDRRWIDLTDNIKIMCITTHIQDAVLLIDICGKLFINLNDSGARDCARFIRKISRNYEHSYLLALAGYGDADMINLFDEDDNFITPAAASKPLVGLQLSRFAKRVGAKSAVPFSSFHQYQREDSIWAEPFTTPMDAFEKGFAKDLNYVPPFCSIDCNSLEVTPLNPEENQFLIKKPEEFGDSWSDELTEADKTMIDDYFLRKERIVKYFGFINFRVGGKDHNIKMQGKADRGISFTVPRHSLMTSVEYCIFDDLLIANFMKTRLYKCKSLYEGSGNFNFNVAKFGDNGKAETEEQIRAYIAEYRKRAGAEFVLNSIQDESRDLLLKFVGRDSRTFAAVKSLYYRFF